MKRNMQKTFGTLVISVIVMTSNVYADDASLIFDTQVVNSESVNNNESDPYTSKDDETKKQETIDNKQVDMSTVQNIAPETKPASSTPIQNTTTENKTQTTPVKTTTTEMTKPVVAPKNMTDEEKNTENKKFPTFSGVENSYIIVRLSSQSKEELKALYERGFRVFEITVSSTRDNQVVLADNFGEYFKKYYGKAVSKPSIDEYFGYKMTSGNKQMSLGDINIFLNNHPDARFFVKTLDNSCAPINIIKNISMKNKDKLIIQTSDSLADNKKINNVAITDLKGKGSIESYIAMNEGKNIVFLYQNTVPSIEDIETIKNADKMIFEIKKASNDNKLNGVIYSLEDAVSFTMKKPPYVPPNNYTRPQIKNDRFIAHAGSKYAGISMTNSWQAMAGAYNRGARLIEIDYDWTTDGKPVQVHDWASFSKLTTEDYVSIDGYYMKYEKFKERKMIYGLKQMSIDDTIQFLNENSEAYVVTDVKEENMQDGNEKILKIFQDAGENIASRIIPQIYSTTEYANLKAMGFKNIIYTLYRTEESPYNVLEFAKLNDLYAVTMDNAVRIYTSLPKLLSENGIRVYTHTENSKSRAKSFMLSGKAYGIYSDTILNDEELK